MKNQYQERAVIIPAGERVLEGLWQKGADGSPVVVGAPHPRLGGSMDSPVVAELAYTAAKAGSPVLRFNYRGVGASQGTSEASEAEVEDFLAAADHILATTGREEYIAMGYSFGAWVAVHAAARDPRIRALVLASPANTLLDFAHLSGIRHRHLLIAAGDTDDLVDSGKLEPLIAENPVATLELVEGADHTYTRGLGTLSRLTREFLGRL